MASRPASTTESEHGTVTVQTVDGIATIRFWHPKGNSLPGRLLRRLAEVVSETGANDGARVIVLRSEGTGAFCGGASFAELARLEDATVGKEFFMGFARLILAMRRAPKLILVRVQGKAVGGGVGVVAAGDYALAHASASVRLSELAVGIGPFVVGPAIERKVGVGAFAALAADTDWRDAAWAERHGLYARVVPTVEELDGAVDRLAAMLARSNPDAMARLKGVLWAGTDDWDELLERRAEMSGRLVLSDYARAAIGRREEGGGKRDF